ncbi:hypothetical protein GALMADRAFT_239042 [Galerina marginata CBS 339.88]|uniref:F-box domain-containing protein n=1 Tax=Galerina marginata (strain CBS 339.88) TaxID=685588 RepID=A0A067TTF0_GALM3|nr:hypothetical protein GALMADRAFT_239042 [Galerina marginata CBS 339.88]
MDPSYRGLPTELLESIIDILFKEQDFVTLKLCSYVNQFFRVLSQSRLFRKVTFVNSKGHSPTSALNSNESMSSYEPALSFNDNLDSSPHIASYVQGLTMPCTWIRMSSGSGNPTHWLQRDRGLPRLLPRLIDLRCLAFPGKRITTRNMLHQSWPRRWFMFSAAIRTALITTLASNTLTELNITGIGLFPSNLFKSCSTLRRLSITTLQTDDPDVQPSCNSDHVDNQGSFSGNLSLKTNRLEYLHLEDLSKLEEVLAWLLLAGCPLDITRLRAFSLSPERVEDVENVTKFSTIMEVLSDLRIDVTRSCDISVSYNTFGETIERYSAPPPDFRCFKAVKSLTVIAFLVGIFPQQILYNNLSSPILWITKLVEGFPLLSQLVLNLSFLGFTEAPEIIQLLHDDWVQLGHCISNANSPGFSAEMNINGLDAAGAEILWQDAAFKELEAIVQVTCN